jgi:adenylate cyclase
MQRRLAAIMAADMVGYSRLMAADEHNTVIRHKSHRKALIDPKIADHGGRVFKTTGDGFLAEFSSVVDAVQCAVAIQQSIQEQEAAASAEQRIAYRIGINLGEMLVDDGDVFGDGVNVAARLEQIADAGGVCVSDVVYQNVRSKLDLTFEGLGPRALKNIPGEMLVYRIAFPGAPAPVTAASKPKLPDKPSIAVLPFTDMSGQGDTAFFADAITEELTAALSRVRDLFVISRHSSSVYKDKTMRVEDVARELGVRFVLEGSVRVAGNRVRVTAQLIDGLSGGHIWVERYDSILATYLTCRTRSRATS